LTYGDSSPGQRDAITSTLDPKFDVRGHSATSAFITADLAGGFATGDGVDTLVAIEDLEGSDTADFLRGDDSSNRLAGGGGADILEGFGGDDFLEGGSGSDIGDGGDGFDTCVEVENVMNCEA